MSVLLRSPSCEECGSVAQYHQEICSRVLTIWVVYYDPSDFGGKHVVRAQHVKRGGVVEVVAEPTVVADSLQEARTYLPPGLYCQGRHAEDDPTIVETWF